MTLTFEEFQRMARDWKREAGPDPLDRDPFAALFRPASLAETPRIIENPYLTKTETIGHWIIWHHPLVLWLKRWFPALRGYDAWPMIEQRPSGTAYLIGRRMLVMHPAMRSELKAALAVDIAAAC